jgi:hypothetical protein
VRLALAQIEARSQLAVGLATMVERTSDIPEQVRKFAPKHRARADGDPTDAAGHALIALVHHAADVSNENCNRAKTVVEKLYAQLRAAENRLRQLEAEVEFHRNRAVCGESWLQRIQQEIEQNLMTSRRNRLRS